MYTPRWFFLTVAAVLAAVLAVPPAAVAAPPASAVPAAAAANAADPPAPIEDPIPEDPVDSRLALTLREIATFPKSEPTPPPTDPRLMRWARINYLGELPDRSGRKYVPDLNGTLYFLRNGTPTPYLDVRAAVGADFFSGRGLGTGFGFVTFHPQFARNGRFYTVHSENGAALTTKTPDFTQETTFLHAVVTEWTATNPRANTFSGTRREVLRIGFAGQIHAIQQIDFNPTARPFDADYGDLYLAVGDGGIGFRNTDPQNLAIPHGKILRIDPLGTDSANGRYGIPADNPFVGREGALGEIYAVGMRDPHRFSWDPLPRLEWNGPLPRLRHRMYLGHIGEHDIEAVYEVRAGDNFGWSVREGSFVFNQADRCNLYPLPEDDASFGFTYPVAAYDHNPPPGWPCTRDVGKAISGGFVYRGLRIPALFGKYLFADLVDGRILYTNANEMRRGGPRAPIHEMKVLNAAGFPVTMRDIVGDQRVDLRFGRDAEGELYLLAKSNGKVWKITGVRRLPALPAVHPSLRKDLVAYYDFEHPVTRNPAQERDRGTSGTTINLINGGGNMRVVNDGANLASTGSLQLMQVNPTTPGNDDWKAGVFSETAVPTLHAFNGTAGATVMAWVKMTGQNPSPNSGSANPDDFYGAIGLAGVLTGESDGHRVRALLELINVNGTMRLVALGRRIDGGASQTFAASADWQTLLPLNEWVFLAATFDYTTGAMALYRNGQPVEGFYVTPGDPWELNGPGPHVASPTDPRGIKIGGSFPQNTREGNPCNCRMDSLMFLNRVVSAREVAAQHRLVTTPR